METLNLQVSTKDTIIKLVNFLLAKISKIDYWFLAAALVETPRLFSSFSVIKEEPIFGVPLSILIAYSTSESWKCYFRDKSRYLILVLNLISLTFTISIIAPVLLYTITYHDLNIDLTKIVSEEFWYLRLVYAIIISASTFLPLIILAATHSYNNNENGYVIHSTSVNEVPIFDERFECEQKRWHTAFEMLNEKVDNLKNEQMEIVGQHVATFISVYSDELEKVKSGNESINEILNGVMENVDDLSNQLNTNLTNEGDHVTLANEDEIFKNLLELIKENPGIGRSDLSKKSGIEYQKLLQGKNNEYGYLGKMMKDNLIEKKGKGFFII